MESVLIQANAKLNLNLEIKKQNKDGYHQIKSDFQSINLSDFLFLKKTRKNNFTGSIVCPNSKNIVLKAKKLLEKRLNRKLPSQIHLQKSIPVAAGLGGGSADAAATLLGLNKLCNLNLSRKALTEIGGKIGKDVPFFFYGGTCKVEKTGEKVSLVKKKLAKFFIIFRPYKRIETKKIYQLYDKTGEDFLKLNRKICPEIRKLEKYLKRFSLQPKLSGSGPTIFCELNDYETAQKISQGYSSFKGDIFICRPEKKALKIIGI